MGRVFLWLLRLAGWTPSFVWPPEPRGLILVYPHTSNWDFVLGLLFRFGCGLPAHWMGKDSMFPWPFAGLLKRIGGIPINRRAASGVISTIVEEFRKRDWLWIAITPEGTRSYTDSLKSGFYQIALAANVPVALGYIDYGERRIGIDTYVRFTGDREKDMQVLRDFYADKRGRHPELAGRIRLRH
ncbi:MAG TPA: 1-acyl-sn-glycerol-3-phosphate acyltransferase [Steroidobacteraceae bacterium]|nr:1-acyl-sn-glycerol-3-phosphate acyltransferase [Steroidobacteraceae bacterium]